MTKKEVSKLASVLQDTVNVEVTFGTEVVQVDVKKWITPAEQAAFVEGVLRDIVVDGKRYRAIVDYIIRVSKISYFTNVPLPASEKAVYALVYGTNIIEAIDSHSSSAGLLETVVYQELSNLENAEANPDHIGRISSAIEGFVGELKNKFTDVDMTELMNMMGGVENLDNGNLIKGLFGGVNHGSEND